MERPTIHIPVRSDVFLSELRDRDRAALVEYLNEREIYDCTLRIPHPYTDADAIDFLAIARAATGEYGHPIHFAVRNSTHQLIGGCGFEDLVVGHRAEIGYWLAKPFWGQGIMTDVVRTACRLAAERWHLVRITAHVFDFNTRSARILEKNGFAFEGTLRKHYRKDSRFIDAKLFALTM